MKRLILVIAVIALVLVLRFEETHKSDAAILRHLLTSDMTAPSEDAPQGVPSTYDWSMHPRVGRLTSLARFDAFTAWGQLYACANATIDPRTRIQLAHLQTWVLLRNAHTWKRVQATSDIQGAAFPENYVGAPVAATSLDSTAVGTSVQMRPGYNFHFWPAAGRTALRATDVAAVVIAVVARLAPDGSDQSPHPCLVLSVGGDMWTSTSAAAVPDEFHDTGDVGIGRFKRVRRRWRLFTMTTASRALLQRYPVPLQVKADQAQ